MRSKYLADRFVATVSLLLIGCATRENRDVVIGDPMRECEIVFINEAERDAYLTSLHNPYLPEERGGFIPDDWMNVYENLKESLAPEFDYGIGDGDFYVDSEFTGDRFLCVEVANERILSPLLLTKIHDVISREPNDFFVDICDSWVFLEYESGEKYPHFNIFVERDRVVVYSESEELLNRLGLSRQ